MSICDLNMCYLSLNPYLSSGAALGGGPRRTAYQEAIKIMVKTGARWKEKGDVVVPENTPITADGYWQLMGGLLAIALLAGENLRPVSPVIIYALLSNVHPRTSANDVMDLSLSFIRQLEGPMAKYLLPWMILPPGVDLTALPEGHRALLMDLLAHLEVNVSGQQAIIYILKVNEILQLSETVIKRAEHHKWTIAIVTSVIFGTQHFFQTPQFENMAKGFQTCIKNDNGWFQVCKHVPGNGQQLMRWE